MPLIAIPVIPKGSHSLMATPMGQQTQTPAEGLRAALARNVTWPILDRVTPLENPRMGGAGVLCLLRIEDRGSPNGGAVEATRQDESHGSFSCTCGILRQGFWISR